MSTISTRYIPNMDIKPLLDFKPSCIVYHGHNPKTLTCLLSEQRKSKQKSIAAKPPEPKPESTRDSVTLGIL